MFRIARLPGTACFPSLLGAPITNTPRHQTAQKKPDDSGKALVTFIRQRNIPSKERIQPFNTPRTPSFHTIGTPSAQPPHQLKVFGGREEGAWGRGEGTFLQKGSLSPPPIKLLTYPSRRGRPCATRRRLRRSLPRAVRPSRRSCGSSLRRCRGRGPCLRRPPAWAAR